MLLICRWSIDYLQDWTISIEQPLGWIYTEGDSFSHSIIPKLFRALFLSLWDCWIPWVFPFHVSRSIAIILVWILLRRPCWSDFVGVDSLTFQGDTILWQISVPLALKISLPPLLQRSLSLRCDGCVYQLGLSSTFSHYLHFDVLWFSEMAHVYCREVSLTRCENYIYCVYKNKYL